LVLILALAAGCAKSLTLANIKAASNASNQVGCTGFKDAFFDAVYTQVTNSQLADRNTFEAAVNEAINKNAKISLSNVEKSEIAVKLSNLYDLLTVQALKGINHQDKKAVLTQLSSLELGDQTTAEKSDLQKQISETIAEIESISQGANSGCTPGGGNSGDANPGDTPINQNYLQYLKAHVPAAVFGAWKTMATAYQSCEAPFLNPVTSATSRVQGIVITGKAPDGIGSTRQISSVSEVNSTHYYIKGFHLRGAACFNVSQNPLIYDYGGRPEVTAAADSKFDFFTNAGSGTGVLGIDCSGFIYTSLAAAGLKVKKSGRLKAIGVLGISSNMLFDPQANGLTCLDEINFLQPKNIQPGDLLVEHGHVVMIDRVGVDPFGLSQMANINDCTPGKINIANFDFVINQSSPVNGGLGMNRYLASDYFRQNQTMGLGLQNYAASLCLVKFGASAQFLSTSIAIVRHSSDSLCVDLPVALNKEECLNSCPMPNFTGF
jgi:cell wall-associated NlpC family hydrolase